MTSLTPAGGFFLALTMVMSAGWGEGRRGGKGGRDREREGGRGEGRGGRERGREERELKLCNGRV